MMFAVVRDCLHDPVETVLLFLLLRQILSKELRQMAIGKGISKERLMPQIKLVRPEMQKGKAGKYSVF